MPDYMLDNPEWEEPEDDLEENEKNLLAEDDFEEEAFDPDDDRVNFPEHYQEHND